MQTSKIVDVSRAFEELFDKQVLLDDKLVVLGLDSLDIVSLIQLLESRFSISIPDKEMVRLKTVRDVVDLVESRIR